MSPIEPLPLRLSRDLDAEFAEVVSVFEGAVFTTALRVSGRPDEAEDLAAETFVRAYTALRRYPPPRIVELQLRPWLITICLNLWRNQVRTVGRRTRGDLLLPPHARAPDESPEDRVERLDQGNQLAAGLQRLPEKQRLAVVLRHVVGLSNAEVAQVLACPESTAKSHVRRGLDQLRALLTVTEDPEVLP